MSALSAEWIVAGVMGLGVILAVGIVVHEIRSWNARLQTLAECIGGRVGGSSVIHFEHTGRACELALRRVRHGPTQMELGVPAHIDQTLSVHKRDFMDTTAAAAGLIKPYTTGDAEFDKVVLIHCADWAVAANLLGQSHTRASLKQLFNDGMHSFIWSAQDQAVIVSAPSHNDEQRNVALINRAMSLAVASAPAPQQGACQRWAGLTQLKTRTEGTGTQAALLLAIALPAVAALPAIGIDVAYEPLDRGPLLRASAAFALLATLAWGRLSWRLRGRGMLDHRAWLPMLPLAALGTWLFGYGAAVGINGAADNATPIVAVGVIEEKFQRPGDNPGDHGLRTTAGSYWVNEHLHRRAQVGDTLHVTTHPGRLGVPWRNQENDIQLTPQKDPTTPMAPQRRKKRRSAE